MKRHNNLYEKIYDINNLKLAHENARKKKTHYKEVRMVDAKEEYYLKEIQKTLINKTYKTGDYEIFTRKDSGKERIVYKLPYYPDRIVQWAIMQIIEPILIRKLIYDTYSAIPKRGTHKGLTRIRKVLSNDVNGTQYCLKIDMTKYYPSINHALLKELYANIFKDSDLLWLLFEIIDSIEMTPDTGIPIGNYLSQWSGNLFLSSIDHYMKEICKCKYYYRYMDDIVIIGESKEYLWDCFKEIRRLAIEKKLTIKDNYQVFPVNVRGIDFLGYRIFRDYALLRKDTTKRYKRKMTKISKKKYLTESDISSIRSYAGWLKWCNSYRLQEKYTKGLIKNGTKHNKT